MRHFLISDRIHLKHNQDIAEIKKELIQALEQTLHTSEVGSGPFNFHINGSTGGLFDFIRRARVSAEVEMILEDTKTEKDLRIIVRGNAVLSYSMATMYLTLFFLILFAGLLPGSIETDSENSTALDALVFLLIGYFIKADIDNGLKEAEEHFRESVNSIAVRFGI